jgi:hypothetical protein
MSETRTRSGYAEFLLVWLLFAVVGVAILVTYSRVPLDELYHVSRSGLRGGASRVLVFSNFPTALVALAILALLFDGLPGRASRAAAGLAALLCAVVFWPGVVSEADLDAKPVNALPAAGVAIALALTAAAVKRAGVGRLEPQAGDRARVLLAVALLAVSLPWLGAEVGASLEHVPVLGRVYLTGELAHQPRVPGLHPAVHPGDHHGMDALLLALTAIVLSRALPSRERPRLRPAIAAYLSLMVCYALGNMANDFWLEQVAKRGWTSWLIPDVVQPKVSVAWGVIVTGAVVLWLVWRRDERGRERPGGVAGLGASP